MSSLLAMRIELTFSNGMKQTIQAEAIVFIKECKGCNVEFRTEDPRKEYHAPDCKAEAKYHRRIKTGWG